MDTPDPKLLEAIAKALAEASADDFLLHEIAAAGVPVALQEAADTAFAYVESDLGAQAVPPDRLVHWFVIDIRHPAWANHRIGGGLRVPRDRPGQDIYGYTMRDGDIWIRLDSFHGPRNAEPSEIGSAVAHEAMHRHHFLALGRSQPPSPDDEREAGNFGTRYMMTLTPEGRRMLAEMDRLKNREPPA